VFVGLQGGNGQDIPKTWVSPKEIKGRGKGRAKKRDDSVLGERLPGACKKGGKKNLDDQKTKQ